MKKQLDILIVLPTAVLGGAERVMFNLAAFLLTEGHRVTVYAMSRGLQPGWEMLIAQSDFEIIARSYNSEKTSLLNFIASMRSLSRRRCFDYVFSSHTHVNAALSFMRRLGVLRCGRLVSRESTFIFERFFGIYRFLMWSLYRFFYGSQDLLICQTARMQDSLVSNLKFAPARAITSIPNPVNVAYIASALAENKSDTTHSGKLVVACGRLIPIKAFHVLIRAFAFVAQENVECHLLIIGDGPEKKNLQTLIDELGMTDRIKLTGRLINPLSWFARADIGVVCSIKEGFPNVLIEMMASGTKAIISTPCSDGILDLPGIDVLNGHSEEEMVTSLRTALMKNVNRSNTYQKYIQEKRTVGSFWAAVQASCVGESA